MRVLTFDAHTDVSLTREPKKHIRKKTTHRTQFFHGNKALKQFRRMRDIYEQMRVWQQHNEPDTFYELEYRARKLKGQFKDDWTINYWSWSPTQGETVAVEWLHDIKSSISLK